MYKVNPYSKLASLYRHTYLVQELPKSGCDYIWGLLFAILIFPFTWTVIVKNKLQKKITLYDNDNYYYVSCNADKPIIGLIFTVLLLLIGIIFISGLECLSFIPTNYWFVEGQKNAINFISNLIIVYFHGVLFVLMILFIGLGFSKLFIYFDNKFPKKPFSQEKFDKFYADLSAKQLKKLNKKPSFFKLMYIGLKAYKEKNCPIFDWDYETFKPKK